MTIQDIVSNLGITPSAMQQASADAILNSDDNIVLLSPTGTGKTLAYLLPITQFVNVGNDEIQIVVIVPGRELAIQSLEVLKSMKTGIRGYACYGGRPTMDEHREIRKLRPQIIFATPGRLKDHLDKENFKGEDIRCVIIDEFDKCLDLGFADEMNRIMDQLPTGVRRIFLSATDTSDDIRANGLLSPMDFRKIDFRKEEENDRVKIEVVYSKEKDKLPTLALLLKSLGSSSSIVFLNYRDSVERTSAYLTENGFVVSAYHGGLDQKQREESIYRFANGSANVLVSTDLGSRGLDIPNVENIIHYHLPETEENYIHRIGRTARWDKTGRTFFILNDGEAIPEYVKGEIVEFKLPAISSPAPLPKMTTLYIGKGKKDKISKGDIVGFLCKSGGLKGNEIGRIDVYDYYSYAAIPRDKKKEVLHNVQGEKIKGHHTKVELMR